MIKLNNKGFAITTILFGTMIIFMLLLVSLLGILSTYHHNLLILIDNSNGSRDIATLNKTNTVFMSKELLINSGPKESGLYCYNNNTECSYIAKSEFH